MSTTRIRHYTSALDPSQGVTMLTLSDIVRPQIVHKGTFGLTTKDVELGFVNGDCVTVSPNGSRLDWYFCPFLGT